MTAATGACFLWRPEDILSGTSCSELKFGLLILNQPVLGDPEQVVSLWKRATLRIAVDGGSNRWLKFCKDHNLDLLPDLITGDMDSAEKETLDFYQKAGVTFIPTPDQDETDFTKALREAAVWFENSNIKADAVISIVETSGRIDQILANINTLFKAGDFINCALYQLGSDSISWLLQPGHHEIHIPSNLKGKICSLVPIGSPAKCVSSTGLKWNLDKQEMKFGELISTSNTYSETNVGLVTVTTDSALLWSMELR